MKRLEIIDKWGCPFCSEVYEDEDEASDCCPKRITHLYGCSICDFKSYIRREAEDHIRTPHDLYDSSDEDDYVRLLQEGVPPLEAWNKSHRVISDDRRIIEEVLQL